MNKTYERDLLRRLIVNADFFLNCEGGREVFAEDGTRAYWDGFLMEVDPDVWREAIKYVEALDEG